MSFIDVSLSGTLTEAEVQRAMERRRDGTISPMTVYYAGVTAPVISAAMALLSKTALQRAGLADIWAYLFSSIMAAFAGIAWYMIFMRWARRNRFGRGGETRIATRITLRREGFEVERGTVRIVVPADAIEAVNVRPDHLVIGVKGLSDVVVPRRWFESEAEGAAFAAQLSTLANEAKREVVP